MANKYEFDMEKIARLVEDEDMTYKEVKEEIGTEAHHKTIGRHYRKWKEEQEKKEYMEASVKGYEEAIKDESEEQSEDTTPGIAFCEECGKEFVLGEGYTKDFCSKECFNDFYKDIPAGEAYEESKRETAEYHDLPFTAEPESVWEKFKIWFGNLWGNTFHWG
jgi:hypothetical protein